MYLGELAVQRDSAPEPVEEPLVPPGRGVTYAHGPHVTLGKNFPGACRCMMVVVSVSKVTSKKGCPKKSPEN